MGLKKWFLDKEVFFKVKVGNQKAAFAEHGIMRVKARLYRCMRSLLSQNWPKFLPLVTAALNATPNVAIGNLTPDSIKSNMDDPKIDDALGGIKRLPSGKEREENKEAYEQQQDALKAGDFVYADFPHNQFNKGFDTQVNHKLRSCFPKTFP